MLNKRRPFWGGVLSDVRHCLSQGGQAVAWTYAALLVPGRTSSGMHLRRSLRESLAAETETMRISDRIPRSMSSDIRRGRLNTAPLRLWLRVKQTNAIVCRNPCFALAPAQGELLNSASTRPACSNYRTINTQHQCCSTFWPALGGKSCQSCYCQNEH